MKAKEIETIGQIEATVPSIKLDIAGALVTIRHEERADVAVKANNPKNWNIANGSVRQTNVQKPLGGGSANVVVNGSIIGASICGNVIRTGRGTTVISGGGRNVSIINGDVYVDGKKVTGSGEPATNSGESDEPDRLELLVPTSYRGGLNLRYKDGSKVDLDHWQAGGGEVSFSSEGGDDLKAGQLTNLGSFVVQSVGSGSFTIESIATKTFVATKTGSGDLEIDELTTDSLVLVQTGSGDTDISDGSANAGSVSSTGSGDVTIRGRFANISKSKVGSGDVKIRVRK